MAGLATGVVVQLKNHPLPSPRSTNRPLDRSRSFVLPLLVSHPTVCGLDRNTTPAAMPASSRMNRKVPPRKPIVMGRGGGERE